MRKTLCTLALTGLLSLAGSAALAQDNAAPQQAPGQWGHGGGRMNPEAQLQHLTKQLDLTADQQAQIKPILESRDQQAKQLWQDQSLAPQDRHTKMKAIQDDSKAKIEAVLNATQKEKYEAMQAKMQEHMHEHMQGEQAPPPPQH
jgi:protein CpxP